MTIFDHLNSILFTKKRNNLQNFEDEKTFSPFMMNRWISMYSEDYAKIINSTSNKFISCFSKAEFNNFLTTILPKSKFKRISYIKKKKESESLDEDEQNKTKLIADALELSQREVRDLLEYQKNMSK